MSNHHRRKRVATTPSPATDWSSLAPDLVSCIGDMFLATSDIDYYMALRAVCHPWRAATDDPCCPDPRFRPRGWAMLGSLDRKVTWTMPGSPLDLKVRVQQGSRRLFLNVNSGRFLWKDMPMLGRRYACLAAADTNGLLVLRARRDLTICVLNPFTGHMVSHDPSGVSSAAIETLKVAMHGSASPMNQLYTTWDSCHAVRNGKDFLKDPTPYTSTALVTFQGRCVYKVDEKGAARVVKAQEDRSRRRQMRTLVYHTLAHEIAEYAPLHTFLIDNAGEILLVRLRTSGRYGAAQIFRINLVDKALHAVTSVGNRAVLLGNRCLSVDALKLPGIESNCIYYIGGERPETRTICIYRLEDGSHEELLQSSPDEMPRHPALPLSLLQVLMDYPKYVEPRFGSACPTWEY